MRDFRLRSSLYNASPLMVSALDRRSVGLRPTSKHPSEYDKTPLVLRVFPKGLLKELYRESLF